MPYLIQLADVARRTGCKVVEVPGWKTRGHGPQPNVEGIVCHHTAGRDDLHIVRDGRPGLAGPLSQFWLRRDGTIFVVAAGRCWHNAPSTSPHHMNSTSIGIEAENNGREPWPADQLAAYSALCAELCRAFKLPASRVKGHREVNTGKVDPRGIDMDLFRAAVGHLLDHRPTTSWTEELVKDLPTLKPGATHKHVKTMRALLFARGYEPANLHSTTYAKDDVDLIAKVNAFKTAHKLADDGIFGEGAWQAALT